MAYIQVVIRLCEVPFFFSRSIVEASRPSKAYPTCILFGIGPIRKAIRLHFLQDLVLSPPP